jgi:hypothetical protein
MFRFRRGMATFAPPRAASVPGDSGTRNAFCGFGEGRLVSLLSLMNCARGLDELDAVSIVDTVGRCCPPSERDGRRPDILERICT